MSSIEEVPKIICKNHCPKGYVLDNETIWCDYAGPPDSECMISDKELRKLLEYENSKSSNDKFFTIGE